MSQLELYANRMSDLEKRNHGGARRNAGRKTEVNEPLVRLSVTVSRMTVRQLRVVGSGNLSFGVRKAAESAFEQYQRESAE